MASLRITKTLFSDNKILFLGAGEAALGIAHLCVMQMIAEGSSHEDAVKRVWLVDSKGLIVKDRPKGGLTEHKAVFAHEHDPVDTIEAAVEAIQPTILIGAAALPGAFTPSLLKKMAQLNARPVIFALSNPTTKAECTAEEAFAHTNVSFKITLIYSK